MVSWYISLDTGCDCQAALNRNAAWKASFRSCGGASSNQYSRNVNTAWGVLYPPRSAASLMTRICWLSVRLHFGANATVTQKKNLRTSPPLKTPPRRNLIVPVSGTGDERRRQGLWTAAVKRNGSIHGLDQGCGSRATQIQILKEPRL